MRTGKGAEGHGRRERKSLRNGKMKGSWGQSEEDCAAALGDMKARALI